MVCITRHSITDDFGQDGSAAPLGEPELFKDHDAGSLAHHEAVAVQVEGPTGFLRSIVPRGESAHRGESADAHGRDRRFCAATNHDVSLAARDQSKGIADGMRARSTS